MWEAQTAEFEAEKQQLQQKLEKAERQVCSSQADVARAAEHATAARAQAVSDMQAHEAAIMREVERNVALATDLKSTQSAQVESPAPNPLFHRPKLEPHQIHTNFTSLSIQLLIKHI